MHVATACDIGRRGGGEGGWWLGVGGTRVQVSQRGGAKPNYVLMFIIDVYEV